MVMPKRFKRFTWLTFLKFWLQSFLASSLARFQHGGQDRHNHFQTHFHHNFHHHCLTLARSLAVLSLALLCSLGLTACQTPTAPLEFAPDGEIVQKALILALNQTQTRLSQQLKTAPPVLVIDHVNVKELEPIVINDLPAYHLTGRYDVTLTLPRQTVTQKQNAFELYLQRQSEGKSWRLLQREANPQAASQWKSYLIAP